ncbi:MAG: tetraacyldisaccharide 4'-kinase, partial [Crocinitomicaceae bacterium]|nr:tetraacyldisaccharide 4'-kinase [Crocinitomicaceae bacterium]
MKRLRILLLPFALLYGAVVAIRNTFYNKGIFSSYAIPKKSIVVGNLSAGGTGKTPLVDYILNHFKELNIKTSVLSR